MLHDTELWLREQKIDNLTADDWREVKSRGFSDSQLARFMGAKWLEVRCLEAVMLYCHVPAQAELCIY